MIIRVQFVVIRVRIINDHSWSLMVIRVKENMNYHEYPRIFH